VSQRHEPCVDEPEFFVCEGGGDATAGCVAADDDVFDFEVLDCVLDDGEGVEVCCVENVGDVAVAEDVAGLEA